jgi:hypothetical protein
VPLLPTFNVEWEIELEAETPQAAAEAALEVLRRSPDSDSLSFTVSDEEGNRTIVDLNPEEEID